MAIGHIFPATRLVTYPGPGIGACAFYLLAVLGMYILGISAYFHDSAACLLKDDHIIAAVQEERFTRKKNDDSFPEQSIKYCLREAGITLKDVGYVVFYEKPFLKFERLLETYFAFAPDGFVSFLKAMPVWITEKLFLKRNLRKALKNIDAEWNNELLFTTHHQSHAASAFYPSPFNDAVILTADGVGEWSTTSVAIGNKNDIKFVKEIRFPSSIGLLYSAFTYYLGFKVNVDEYKVMGLAPYGKPVYVDVILNNLIDLKDDGSFWLDMQYFNYCTGLTMTSSRFHELFGSKPRVQQQEITQFHMDIACSIQAVAEQVMLKIATALYKEYKLENLCMAGGVALNCVANGRILKESGFKNIWIQPAAGDAGGALGAAYAVYYQYLGNSRDETAHDKMQNALLGPHYNTADIKQQLISNGIAFKEPAPDDYYKTIARYIADGKVVGYFKGRMEFGPRALGARSIIADPRNADMQSILNQKIKFRESFRPFAPAILEEYAADFFETDVPSPYMLVVADVKPNCRLPLSNQDEQRSGFEKLKIVRSVIPAVTHVNNSARLQTVNKTLHPDFYNLINAFYELTNYPLLINTSFNRMDEPIVNTPVEALACFNQTGMDVLVLEDLIITKSSS
ncbi:carbamoyltransferase [Mucilaginibacter mallensis]|uniref:Carbamoyltransferase n=2 Tax=Mucilaginibacter mallensis TaxID=652787 RepID=A0A1H1SH15_MUCMA|nr:carbamoyltransferase [Mucilaginibacter mallensis]